jgi:hypothetical protein
MPPTIMAFRPANVVVVPPTASNAFIVNFLQLFRGL